jgi:hypothetical protein
MTTLEERLQDYAHVGAACSAVHPDTCHGQYVEIQEKLRFISLKRAGDSMEIETLSSDGKQSLLLARFDLEPPFATEIRARVLATGAEKYGAWNWTKIPSESHLNHAMQHIAKFLQDDKTEDHAANACVRLTFWLDMLVREGKRAKENE